MCELEHLDPPKKRTRNRLKRIGGQVEGLVRMVEEDRYCVDILTQISAVQAALSKVGEEVLERHLETCVASAMASGDTGERDRVVAELMEVVARSSAFRR